MSLMPISISLLNKSVVIIGGGKVAERKAIKLLKYEANITIVSPDLTETLAELAHTQAIQWIQSSYKKKYLDGAFLIIAATDNPDINLSAYQDKMPSQLITIVDQPDLSDFHMVSTLQRGKLTLSVSTEGSSPILAKKIVNHLSEVYGREYEEYVEFLYHARKKILENINNRAKSREFLIELVEDERFHAPMRDKWFNERMEFYKKQVKE